jgi:hypothetical protein
MANISLGFNLSASAVGMSQGINAGVVELQKLGYSAKKTAADVSTLKTIELSRVFINSIRTAGSAFSSFIAGTAGAVAQIDDLANRTGIATEVIQGYLLAANQSGVGLETFGRSIQKLTVNLGEAQTGNKSAIKSFSDLGLSVTDLSKLSPDEAFNAVAASISKLPGPAQQAAAAVGLFGKAGVELVPLFQEGAGYLEKMTAEAQRLGLVLRPEQTAGITALDDSLEKVTLTIQGFAVRVLAELAPSLRQAANAAVEFIAKIDVREVANATSRAISTLGGAFALLTSAAVPLAGNLLPAIGGYLAFINRQVVVGGISNLAKFFAGAAAAALGYSGAAGTAATATAALGVSIRATLASTGIGVLVVGLGLLAGAALEWAVASKQAAGDAAVSVEAPKVAFEDLQKQIEEATNRAQAFGEKTKEALKVPQLNVADFAQDSLNQAESAFKQLAEQMGGLANVPIEIKSLFGELTLQAQDANNETMNQVAALREVDAAAKALAQQLGTLADARKADADAAKAAGDAAKKAAEDARSRVGELANQSLPASEQSRLQLMKDMLAVSAEQRAAEQALAAARAKGDVTAVAAAKERLRLAQLAGVEAKNQDRIRQREALGITDDLIKPAKTIADQFSDVRKAFDQKLIDGGEARQALRNLAQEGIQIRQEILAELSRPSQQALQVSDVRTSEGMSQFLQLTREDPAIAQRREQLAKLEQIRKGLEQVGANPVDILGA